MFEITYAGPEFAVKGPASDTTFHKTMGALGGINRQFGTYYYPLTLSKLQEDRGKTPQKRRNSPPHRRHRTRKLPAQLSC